MQRILALAALRLRERRTAKVLRDAPLRSIRSARNHYAVKITGRLHVIGEPLVAPITGRECAFYSMLGVAEPLVFRDGVLTDGEQVTVCGMGRWEVNPDPNAWSLGYRDFPRRLRIDPLPDGKLHVSDIQR